MAGKYLKKRDKKDKKQRAEETTRPTILHDIQPASTRDLEAEELLFRTEPEHRQSVKTPQPANAAHPEMKKRRCFPLPLYLIFSFFFMELVLFLASGETLFTLAPLYFLLSAAVLGLLLFAFSLLFRSPKTCVVLLTTLLFLFSIYFCVQYCCNSFFHVYMSLGNIFVGAGGVATDFVDEVVGVVLKGVGVILLMLIPPVLMLILNRLHRLRFGRISSKKRSVAQNAGGQPRHTQPDRTGQRNLLRGLLSLGLSVLLFFSCTLSIRANETAGSRYAKEYNFDIAVPTFGLLTATRLDLQYLLFGNNAASSFTPVPPASSESTDPSDAFSSDPSEPDETEPSEPPVIEYGYNEMDIDFAALAEEESNSTVASMHAYVSSLAPTKQNEYTGMFEGKNLILITAEAFSKEAISEKYTPTLYRLATKGMQFNDYYQPAWGGSTSTGEYSVFTGLIPTYGVSSILKTADLNMYFTLGNQLQRENYYSAAYHAHTYDYYDRDLTHQNLGYSVYMGRGNGLEDMIVNQWPESDLELMDATIDRYITNEPFSIYYMTVSGHANYSWMGNMMSYNNKDAVADMDASESVQAYMAANIELDKAMARLIERLEAAGIADNTVIVISTDHYPYGLEDSESDRAVDGLSELYGYNYSTPWERDHSALIIWSGCLEDEEPIVVDAPVYSLDIVPTVANLMGLEYDSRLLVGRDVFSDAEPLVIWADYSWKTDKASYNSSTGAYTVFSGYEDEVDEEYYERIRAIVSNKFAFSKNVLDTDYYYHIFGEDTVN